MPIRDSLYFIYDGIESLDMGIVNVNMETGMLEENFLPEQTINETTIRGNDTPYFIEQKKTPFKVNLTFAFVDNFDEGKLEEVYRWLGKQTYYKPMVLSNDWNKVYYLLYTGEPRLLHNSLKEGYVTIEMRSISPYTYSPVYQPEWLDCSSNNANGMEFVVENKGGLICKPQIKIQKIGDGEISIVNESNRGKTFRVVNLVNNETIDIDCEKEDIVSDISLNYHFDDTYGAFPSFVTGYNYLRIYGKCKIQWRYQFVN
ncbi:phage tail domain-containing protein [Paenibacillus sp. GCM10012306]|uniref:phage tail domain-containing protein n=1 Tax=Paenibacillus sp. GCM10012306 TaxID=3317342 RepID=UPI0036122E60